MSDEDDFGIPGVKVGMGIIDLKEIMQPHKGPSIAAHYGVKEKDFVQMRKDIMCDLIQTDSITAVLDTHFKSLSHEDRLRVIAFADSHCKFCQMND